MIDVGFIGWRGMVGSVLMERMRAEGDFAKFNSHFFSTSQAGERAPNEGGQNSVLHDAANIDALSKMDVILTCQGGSYTKEIHPKLRSSGWSGYWVDAASTLRMEDSSIIVLDPLNSEDIHSGLTNGTRDFVGGNCTVSLMLLAMHGLLKAGLVNWISAMTYQAASGAGAKNMKELITQMGHIHRSVESSIEQDSPILNIDEAVLLAMNSKDFPVSNFGIPLAGNLIPWIDSDLGNGQSREEWKAQAEGNKILGTKDAVIPIDGLCVRIGAMRCHSQALTFNLKEELPTSEIEEMLDSANEWVKVIPNTRDNSIDRLSPVAVTRTLDIPIGRIRKMSIGRACYSAFTVGDQLLWGAAEPLRRMLKILVAQG